MRNKPITIDWLNGNVSHWTCGDAYNYIGNSLANRNSNASYRLMVRVGENGAMVNSTMGQLHDALGQLLGMPHADPFEKDPIVMTEE